MRKFYSFYFGLALLLGLYPSPEVNAQTFTEQTGVLPASGDPVSWGDFNNDGHLDAIIIRPASDVAFAIWKNNGNGTFTQHASFPFVNASTVRALWADFDNDGFLDIVVAGANGLYKTYKNNGSGGFTENRLFSGTINTQACDVGDYDQDGDMDIIVAGWQNAAGYRTKLLRNDGNFIFTEVTNTGLPDVSGSTLVWKDIDNDGDLDLFLSGVTDQAATNFVHGLYLNNGDHTFSLLTTLGITNAAINIVVWGDYDNDGFHDLLIRSRNNSTNATSNKVYRNNGNKTFSELTSIVLPEFNSGFLEWVDFNNDGKLDITMVGMLSGTRTNRFYSNNGNGTFTLFNVFPTLTYDTYSGRWADYDNDGDMDLALTGFVSTSGSTIRIFKNSGLIPNTAPLAPSGLTAASPNGKDIVFKWNKATDAETAQNGLTYNISVYDVNNGKWVRSPASFGANSLLNGRRTLVQSGHVHYNIAGYTLKDLPSGTYRWSVQAIDASMAGGKFAAEQTFTHINLSAVKLHAGNGTLSNTSTGIQYSLNSTNGINGTWITCTTNSTNVNLGDGGMAVWVREAANTANTLKVADVPVREAAPVFTIEFRYERTKEIASTTVEYSENADFSGAIAGVNWFIRLVPGVNQYIRLRGTETKLASHPFMLVVPARPATPNYSIDFITEKTKEVLKSSDFYTYDPNGSWGGGTNATVPLTPGRTIYFKTFYSATNFAGEGMQELVVPARPANLYTFSIDYGAETTKEVVPTTISYATSATMSNATAGTGAKAPILPGQNLYFAVPATATSFKSDVYLLQVPARPATPSFTINFNTEYTNETVPGTVQYSTTTDMSFPTAGTGTPLSLLPGQNLYFAVPASSTSFKSSMFTLNVPARPATPAFTIDYFTETTAQVATASDEYSKNADMSAATTGTGIKIALNPGADWFYLYLRKKASITSFASNIQRLLVKDRAFTPDYAIDYKTETTNLFIGIYDEYAYTADMSGAVAGTGSAKAPIYPGRPIYIRAKATTSRFASVPLVLNAPARPATPNYKINFANETTDKAVSSNDQVSDNINMTFPWYGENMIMPVQAGQNLYFKTLATATSFASEIQTLIVPARPAAPAYSINFAAENTQQVVASNDEYAYSADMASAQAGTGISLALVPGRNVYFRKKATLTSFKSGVQTLTVAQRPAAPAYTINFMLEKTNQTVPATDEHATNVNMTAATTGTGTTVTLTPAQAIYFRKKATTTAFSSVVQTLNVPARAAAPAYTIDFINEITGQPIATSHEYAFDINMSTPVTGTASNLTLTPGQHVYLRAKATTTAFSSAIQTLTVPARPAAPAYGVDFINETTAQVIAGTDEYSNSSTLSGAISGSGVKLAVTPGQALYFRKKATATAFKSAVQTLNVPARPATPAYTINFAGETTQQVVASTDEHSASPDMTPAYAGSGGNLVLTPGQNLYFRKKATSTSFKSAVQTLAVPQRPAAPAHTINFVLEKTAEAVPATEEYATNATMTAATAGTGTTITVSPGQALYFRKKATSTSFSSTIATLTAPARPAFTGSFSINYLNETTAEPVATTYEHAANSNMSGAISGTNNPVMVTPGQPLYIRVKATSSSFASNNYTLSVANRPAAPSDPVVTDEADTFGWTFNPSFSNASSYELTTDAGASWTVCTANPTKLIPGDFAAGTVQVRIKATASSFKSDALLSNAAFTRALGLPSFTEAGMQLYPNPAQDFLYLNELPENASLMVYTLNGKLVKTYSLQQQDNKLDISELKPGIYLLRIQGNKLNAQLRLVKQ